MSQMNYWSRMSRHQMSRRHVLSAGAKAGAGAAGLALVGCGDDDDDDAVTAAAEQTGTPSAAEQTLSAVEQAEQAEQAAAQAEPAEEEEEAVAVTPGDPRQGGTLRVGLPGDAAHLDFALRVDIMQARNSNLVYSKLYTPKRGPIAPEVEPQVADGFPEYPSPLETIVNLRQDVYFQDVAPVNGRQLVAEDLVVHHNYISRDAETTAFAYAFEPVDSVEAVDQFTARYNLRVPFRPLVDYFGDWYAGNLPAKEVLEQDGDLKSTAIGTGPFIMTEWRKEVGIFLERNPNYFDQPQPYLDNIEILVVPDASARLAAFRAGDHHYLEQFPTALAETVRDAVDGVKEWPIDGWHQGMVLNSNVFPDKRMRQALSLSIDRDALNDAIYQGFGKPSGPIAPMWGELVRPPQDFEFWRYDPQKALQLMDAAGYADGIDLDVKIGPYGGDYEAASEAVIASVRDAGFNLSIQTPVYADWIGEVYTNGDYDTALIPFLRPQLDVQTYGYYHSQSGGNFTHTVDPDLDVLCDALRATTSEEDYREALLKFEDHLAEECYHILDVQPPFWYFGQPELQGMNPGIANYFWSNLMQVVSLDA